MHRITGNSLLLGILVVLVVYISISLIVPSPVFAVGISVMLMLSAGIVCRQYLPTTYDIVVNKLRNGADNSHLVVFGISLLALGAIYTGFYGISWEYWGRPVSWVGTWYSRLGQLMNISGFLCLAFSPDFSAGPPKLKNAIIVAVLFMVSVAAAFIAGNRSGSYIDDGIFQFRKVHGESRIPCPSDKPYWISSSGKIHGPLSRWRSAVIPKQCFSSQSEAMKAGFNPAQ